MRQEINPKETSRAQAFNMWMKSPMPMVTFVKTLDVSRLVKASKRTGIKFNILMCWCIGKAAKDIKEFYLLVEQGKLFQFDKLAINIIVDNCKGGISTCDVPYSDDLQQFNADYLRITQQTATTCRHITLEDYMIIGTSTLVQTEVDCVINQYSGIFNNPFLVWGRYHKGWFKTTLPVSLQYHHVQMDGGQAATFLQRLQDEIEKGL
jgi:chloramphenicol O-acetyltransferase type A